MQRGAGVDRNPLAETSCEVRPTITWDTHGMVIRELQLVPHGLSNGSIWMQLDSRLGMQMASIGRRWLARMWPGQMHNSRARRGASWLQTELMHGLLCGVIRRGPRPHRSCTVVFCARRRRLFSGVANSDVRRSGFGLEAH